MSIWRFSTHSRKFRLGNALGLMLLQDQAANTQSSSLQKRTYDLVLRTVQTRLLCAAPCTYNGPRILHQPSSNEKLCKPSIILSEDTLVRTYSTEQPSKDQGKKDSESTVSNSTESENSPSEPSPEHVGIFQRFKSAYRQYGKLLVGVHVATSCVWYGSFVYAAATGFDVVPLLESWGASETIIKPFQSGLGNFAAAYLMYKLATPARYTVTIVGTQITSRKLKEWGYMKQIPQGDKFRDLVSEGRDKMKDRYDEIKDDVKDFREDVKDKVDLYKDKKKSKKKSGEEEL